MIFVALAGLLGAAGVALAAAAAHVESSVALRAAAEIAMVHAVAVIALVAFTSHADVRFPFAWSVVTAALFAGAAVFTAAVSANVFNVWQPIPALAPIGGSLTIVAWIGVFVAGLLEWIGR